MNVARHSLGLLILVAWLFASCGDRKSALPSSGGALCEVVVVNDTDGTVARSLQHPVKGLPQAEPMFDVVAVSSRQFGSSLRMARSIVIVDVDAKQYTRTTIRYERNVHADPQIVVHVHAPSPERLQRDLQGGSLSRLLIAHEMQTEIARLQRKHNAKAEAIVQKQFGCQMLLPQAMTKRLTASDFVWFSDDGVNASTNICIYRSTQRDSVMQRNIKGETDTMSMTTVAQSVHRDTISLYGQPCVVSRGLWEMKADAMGGPFVSYAIRDTVTGRTVVAEAFVYAPSMNKRNLMLRAEASLLTLRWAAATTNKNEP